MDRKRRVSVCLTVAGLDPTWGAGVGADVVTFAALGAWPTAVVTGVTVQDTCGVKRLFPLDPELVHESIQAVATDLEVEAAKCGMLVNAGIIHAVAQAARGFDFTLVVDPVLRASSEAELLEEGALPVLVEELFPLATVITPNIPEAERLTGMEIRSVEEMERAAQKLLDLCRSHRSSLKAILIKGGHLSREREEVVDLLVSEEGVKRFVRPRLGPAHGTGCVLSAAICALLAQGLELPKAVEEAEKFLERALKNRLPLGEGMPLVNPASGLWLSTSAEEAEQELATALEGLGAWFGELIPEVGANLALAPEWTAFPEDMVAVEGRITETAFGIRKGPPRRGASSHVARLLLAVRERFPEIRAALNVRSSEEILQATEAAGLSGASFIRDTEEREGETMATGTRAALSRWEGGSPPDFIFDSGALGKEPMVRLLGRSATEVVDKARRIYEHLGKGEKSG